MTSAFALYWVQVLLSNPELYPEVNLKKDGCLFLWEKLRMKAHCQEILKSYVTMQEILKMTKLYNLIFLKLKMSGRKIRKLIFQANIILICIL